MIMVMVVGYYEKHCYDDDLMEMTRTVVNLMMTIIIVIIANYHLLLHHSNEVCNDNDKLLLQP